MARHILAGRGHPVFFYGSAYDGSFEPHIVAAAFALFGPSFTTYRFTMALLVTSMVAGVFAMVRFSFGSSPALTALFYLAIPAFFLLYRGLCSDGAYASVPLMATAVLAVSLAIDRDNQKSGARVILFALLGLSIGIGWWITPITAPVSAAALVWLFFRRPSPFRKGIFPLFVGASVGAFPWWFWNARHGWASLKMPELRAASPWIFLRNLWTIFWTCLPTLEGGIVASPDVRRPDETIAPSRVLVLVAIAVLLAPAVKLIFAGDRPRLLFGLALVSIGLASAASGRLAATATEPRFLFAYYAITAPLVGAAFIAPLSARASLSRRAAALGTLILVHAASILVARPNLAINDQEVTGSLEPLQKSLEKNHLSRAYANYWTAYRLSFESGERIIATPLTGDEVVRYEPYRQEVDSAPDPAVILLSERDSCFQAFLDEKGFSYRRSRVDSFGVYDRLAPPALASLRAGLGLPLPSTAYRVAWQVGPQPSTMAPGESTSVRVEVGNDSPCVWPTAVHLSYHWWPLSPGISPSYEGRRGYMPDVLRPGGRAAISIRLEAPLTPGPYRLEYDLVHENVVWFSNKGAPTSSVPIEVSAKAKAYPS
jgi:hypothetical protein